MRPIAIGHGQKLAHQCYVRRMDAALTGLELTALLGRGTRFDGKLYFTGRLRIDGSFSGEIRSDDVLVIGDGADVTAEIDVATVIVRGGTVTGNVRARTAIELYVPARIVGSLRSPSIFIDKGVKIDGSCTMAPVDGDSDEEVKPKGAESQAGGPG
jgi:cytoskeletal protein CcmA (bactofilin family)